MTGRGRWLLAAGAAVVLVAAGVVVVALVLGGDDEAAAGDPGAAVEVSDAGGQRTEACLLLADSEAERRQGLMGVTDLGGFDGMLFEFPAAEPLSFWMRNTPMPLSIAFYGADGRFVSAHDMEPCGDREDCPLTSSAGPARWAVEVPQGALRSFGMAEGSQLERTGGCRR